MSVRTFFIGLVTSESRLAVFWPQAPFRWCHLRRNVAAIDTANGGSIGGTLRATEENLKLASEKTLVIPGHGPVGRRADLTEFRDMLMDIRDAVAKLKKEGKTVEEAIAAKPTSKWDKKYTGFAITPEHFTRIAYAGV